MVSSSKWKFSSIIFLYGKNCDDLPPKIMFNHARILIWAAFAILHKSDLKQFLLFGKKSYKT